MSDNDKALVWVMPRDRQAADSMFSLYKLLVSLMGEKACRGISKSALEDMKLWHRVMDNRERKGLSGKYRGPNTTIYGSFHALHDLLKVFLGNGCMKAYGSTVPDDYFKRVKKKLYE